MSDLAPPILKQLNIPATIDVSTGQAAVLISVEADDGVGGTGVDSVTVILDNKLSFTYGAFSNFNFYDAFGGDTFKDSTPTTATTKLTLTDATNPGTYHVTEVWVKDMAGNQATYTSQQLAALGINTTFQVTGGKTDTSAPSLVGLDLPSTIDLSSGSATVPVSVTATDNPGGSGIDSVTVILDNKLGFTYGAFSNFNFSGGTTSDTFKDSTPTTATTKLALTDATNPGTYHITEVWVKDIAGNQATYTSQQLAALGINTTFQVTGAKTDTVAPTLVALDLPSTIDLSSGSKTILVGVTATDNPGGSGIDSVTVILDNKLSFTYGAFSNFNFSGGTTGDTFTDSTPTTATTQLSLTDATNPGTYHITEVWVKDRAGNQASYTAQQLSGLGINTAFSVASAVPANHPHTGDVSITGNASQNQTLTASNTLADVDGMGPVSYLWLRDGSPIAGATAQAYVLTEADVGKSISVRASYTDANHTNESATSSGTGLVANVNDAPSGYVKISGAVNPGATLSVANTLADADGMGPVSYQWLRNGTNISGATNSTLALTAADVGATITACASYIDGHGTAESVMSAGVTVVPTVNSAPTGSVSITGMAVQNGVLVASNDLSDADGIGPVSYQWQRDGKAVAGATGTNYQLSEADVGAAISVRASYTDGLGKVESVTSAGTTAIANINDAPTGHVTVTGNATQGVTLTVSNTLADADGMGAVSYQWMRDGTAIADATAAVYTLSQADVGHTVQAVASYTDGHGAHEAVSSVATATVSSVAPPPPPTPGPSTPPSANTPPTGTVILDGVFKQGELISAASKLQDAEGMGPLSWQWQRDGTDISGATSGSYRLTQDDVGKHIAVVVHYTDGAGNAESAHSVASDAVVNTNDAPAGYLLVAGTAAEGDTLTVVSTVSDADGMGKLQYQWLRDGTAITGATSAQYTLLRSDVGGKIAVQASYTDGFGAHEVVSSHATNTVVASLAGDAASQLVAGTSGNDDLHGGSGGDTFVASQGSDKVDGGGGLDVLVYAAPSAQFDISMGARGFIIADKSGNFGSTEVMNVERVLFGDAAVALDINGTAGMAFRLYQAVFDRAPDPSGLGYWLNALDGNTSLHDVAQSFMDSNEFKTMYGTQPDNTSFLTALYKFALHREPDQGGLSWWNDAIQTGKVNKVDALIQFSESAENQTQVIGSEQHGIKYMPWH